MIKTHMGNTEASGTIAEIYADTVGIIGIAYQEWERKLGEEKAKQMLDLATKTAIDLVNNADEKEVAENNTYALREILAGGKND